MPCIPSAQVVDAGADAHLVLDDCQAPLYVAILRPEEAIVVAAALDAAAVYNVSNTLDTVDGLKVMVERVENPPEKALVLVGIKDGPWKSVLIGTEVAKQRADELRAAVA